MRATHRLGPIGLRLSAAALAVLAFTTVTQASCPDRVVISGGDASVAALARACGVNVEALKSVNPGMTGNQVKQGTVVRIPRAPIAMPHFDYARPQARIASPQVPIAPGPSSSTVILPPPVPSVPQQHILRGFGDQPGQLPLPDGHVPPAFGHPPLFPQ